MDIGTVLEWAGDLDAGASARLAEALEALRHAGETHVIVDLGGVSFVGSAGFGVLVAESGAFRETGGDLWLCGFRPEVRGVADLLGLPRVARVHRDVAEARSALRAATMTR
ncbi:MAG: STAS domain-containing protein [Candidatus Sericytochromatia bacterium]|nr:STAS domain-containing protein [Candidatus Sericytochromatia bacterium]